MLIASRFKMRHMLLTFMTIGASYMAFDYFKPITYTADKWVIFDFDGTLAATIPGMIVCVNELQPIYGYALVRDDELDDLRRQPAQALVQNRFGLSWWQLPLFQYRFRNAAKKHLDAVQLNSGMHAVLVALKQAGYKIGIISSNSAQFITKFFKKNNLPQFDDISESSIFGKADVITKFMQRNGICEQNAVYVGDETRDIEASRKAQVACIAVGWGGNCVELLLEYKPDALVHEAHQLLSVIRGYVG